MITQEKANSDASKGKIKDAMGITAIGLFGFLLLCLFLPFIPATLAEYCPEPLKRIFEWVTDYGIRISHFLP